MATNPKTAAMLAMLSIVGKLNSFSMKKLTPLQGETNDEIIEREVLLDRFRKLRKFASAKHEGFIVIHCEKFTNEKTRARCVVFGIKSNGRFFVGTSRHVVADHHGAFGIPTRTFVNVEQVNFFLEQMREEGEKSGRRDRNQIPLLLRFADKALVDMAEKISEIVPKIESDLKSFIEKLYEPAATVAVSDEPVLITNE
jgi:hypothetical protein